MERREKENNEMGNENHRRGLDYRQRWYFARINAGVFTICFHAVLSNYCIELAIDLNTLL